METVRLGFVDLIIVTRDRKRAEGFGGDLVKKAMILGFYS